ncbi:TIGR03619 family F420-dependent LLM class oxidoreductase (plasmid) [Streptomyces sp. BI20]|uniref:TIGR03619 family F420-dependent LLM class oxidoreductase n=1 Tax=Streptomyces sp. BI20 TaxID=3403460 RepID=UPI003C722BCF
MTSDPAIRLGLALPQYGEHALPETVAPFARAAEEAGFTSLWVSDRVLTPVRPAVPYPGRSVEDPFPPGFLTFLDPLTVLTVAASATRTVALGTSTLNAPWYPPLLLARSLTSIDRLSGGRLEPGFGIGWMPEEYRAVGADFHRRGALLDEALDVLEAIWAGEEFSHSGPAWEIPLSRSGLRPARALGPPIHLGGFGAAALRRVGRRAAGWVGFTAPPAVLDPLWDVARRAAREAGRDPDALRRHLRHNVTEGEDDATTAAAVRAALAWGADSVLLDHQHVTRRPDESLERALRVLDILRG